MKFSKGHACPMCGRSGENKGNLITTVDLFTQSVYLTDDAYVFINPYWNKKLIPDPWGYLELIKLLHKKQAPDKNNKLVLEEVFDEGEIITDEDGDEYNSETRLKFELHKFKFLWLFNNCILTWLPYEYRDWFSEASFFVSPTNEDLPYFGWLKEAIESRYIKANYKFDDADNTWQPNPHAISSPIETPSKYELDFLNETDLLVREYLREYAFKPEITRIIYDEAFLTDIKKVVDEYDESNNVGKKWDKNKMVIEDYRELLSIAWNEFKKLRDHIERKLDNTRKGYVLYTASKFEKVNENRMLVYLKRDFTHQWYEKAFKYEGMWTFQKRPLTKKQMEEWNEVDYGNGDIVWEPLKSHIFCPSQGDSNKSDDYSFDNFRMITNADSVSSEEMQEFRKNALLNAASEDINYAVSLAIQIINKESDFNQLSNASLREALERFRTFETRDDLELNVKQNIMLIIKKFGYKLVKSQEKLQKYNEIFNKSLDVKTNVLLSAGEIRRLEADIIATTDAREKASLQTKRNLEENKLNRLRTELTEINDKLIELEKD